MATTLLARSAFKVEATKLSVSIVQLSCITARHEREIAIGDGVLFER